MAAAGQLIVGDVPVAAAGWQGRPGLLGLLKIPASGGRPAVLVGLSGAGKSQLAAEYAWLRIRQGWPVVVWAAAATRGGIVNALNRLAIAARIHTRQADPEQAARAALHWLGTRPGPCLLVYDGAADADLVRDWIRPDGLVHVVVTTTNRDLDTLGAVVDVPVFTPTEAVAYLRQRTGLDHPDGAVLAEQLGRLPLVLAQAAALIGAGRRYLGYAEYRQALADVSGAVSLPRTARDPDPLWAVKATMLSLDDLARTDGAARLLNHLAVLAPIGADRVLLDRVWEQVQPTSFQQAKRNFAGVGVDPVAAGLAARSLTVVAANTHRTVVHPLVQHVARARAQQAGTLDATIVAAAHAVLAAADKADAGAATATLTGEYATHIDTLTGYPANGYTCRVLIGTRLWMLQRLCEVHNYPAAAALGAPLLRDCERLLHVDSAATTLARTNLAHAYLNTGRVDEAVTAYERVLADRYRTSGLDDPDTLAARHTLATAYHRAGRLDDAITLYEHTIADHHRVLGPHHPDTLAVRDGLASAYQDAGRSDDADRPTPTTLASPTEHAKLTESPTEHDRSRNDHRS